MTKNMRKNPLFVLLAVAVWLVVVLGVVYIWLSAQPLTPAKLKTLAILPFPLALVNGHPVSTHDFLQRLQLTQAIGAQAPQANAAASQGANLNKLIEEQKIRLLAGDRGIAVSNEELDAEFNAINDSRPDLAGVLKRSGFSEADFRKQILEPQLLKTDLQIWFNGQTELNTSEYQLAKSLLGQLRAGADMVELARQYSQDGASRPFGGDLGFVRLQDVLPELRPALAAMQIGDIALLTSRVGLHIIRLENKQNSTYQLREILLSPENFDSWLETQTKNYSVKILIKI